METLIVPDQRNDDNLRHRNNLIAIVFVLGLAIAAVLIVKLMVDSEKSQRCMASGRRDCVEVSAPPRTVP